MTDQADASTRRQRVDAQRNLDALLAAAKEVFAEAGVDAPVKAIADRAGVGVATLYRHFPRRSELVVAVLQHEVDECIAAAAALRAEHPPALALELWLGRYAEFVATKRGLAAALHSGDAAFDGLGAQLLDQLEPAATSLLAAAVAEGQARSDVSGLDVLRAIAHLSHAVPGEGEGFTARMVAVLLDGLRTTPGA